MAPATVNEAGVVFVRGFVLRSVVGVAVVAALASCSSDGSGLHQAIAIAEDEGAFENGPEAGESLARIAQHLEDARSGCSDDDGARCAALGVASGYAQVLAARVLQCTAPGRFEARTHMLDLLEAVDELETDAADLPEPRPLPDCT